ncbi:MAG: tRNA (N6-threonylcarbamoyladenosine(37)-N6)-methyltransferase TrmO [Ruminococcaceae bacterium]|nr:tRNA (N6-threonylcarbamoyladenosine(37)-N6)-methyltransferase TrmO [Oscillospiraceae bacterium]
MIIEPIAYIENDMPKKFGVPRQSGIAKNFLSRIVFEDKYRDPNALRGIKEYSHLWLIWEFTETIKGEWSPTVRPPRLGGNKRVGVFATRSPNRPNNLGLTLVRLEEICDGDLIVSGADIISGTPIYDIKPYLPGFESIPEAKGGFADDYTDYTLKVDCPPSLLEIIPEDKYRTLIDILSTDPRPSYQNDTERIYGLEYAGFEIKFKVNENTLKIINAERLKF